MTHEEELLKCSTNTFPIKLSIQLYSLVDDANGSVTDGTSCMFVIFPQTRYMSERKLEPQDVPGTFLNLALLNLGSSNSALRTVAYKLLSAVKDAFKFRIACHLESSHDICIPVNCTDFVLSVSRQLARNEPHLTLEFLSEVVARFQSYSPALKQHCLAYISPWLPNLSRFTTRGDTPSEREKVGFFVCCCCCYCFWC